MNEQKQMDQIQDIKKLAKKLAIVYVATAATTCVFGFTIGLRVERNAISRGIQRLWDTDPTLKEHMVKVTNEILAR